MHVAMLTKVAHLAASNTIQDRLEKFKSKNISLTNLQAVPYVLGRLLELLHKAHYVDFLNFFDKVCQKVNFSIIN